MPQPGSGKRRGLDEAIEDKPRWRRARRVVLVVAFVLLGALIALWTQRKPIAASYIDKMLKGYGVPVRYRIADLGFRPPAADRRVDGRSTHPDLVADWIELRTSVGLSGAEVTAVRAGHVRMNARLVDGRVSLGALDKFMPAPFGQAVRAAGAPCRSGGCARIRLIAPHGVRSASS